MRLTEFLTATATGLALMAGTALAAPVAIEAIMAPQEVMTFDMNDGTRHAVRATRRTGTAVGEGVLAGADVTEFGWHDVHPPFGGNPQGYLRFEADNGDVAIVQFKIRAIFVAGAEKPVLHDDGYWELVRGTGQFADKRGVGVIKIERADGDNRLFTVKGEIGDKP